jgi:hypothetical protein
MVWGTLPVGVAELCRHLRAGKQIITDHPWKASARRGRIMSPLARRWTHRNGERVDGMDASPALPASWRLNHPGKLPLGDSELRR